MRSSEAKKPTTWKVQSINWRVDILARLDKECHKVFGDTSRSSLVNHIVEQYFRRKDGASHAKR